MPPQPNQWQFGTEAMLRCSSISSVPLPPIFTALICSCGCLAPVPGSVTGKMDYVFHFCRVGHFFSLIPLAQEHVYRQENDKTLK